MKPVTLLYLFFGICTMACDPSQKSTNSDENEWKKLFNERNLEGWIPKMHRQELGDNYKETFKVVQGGILEVNYGDYEDFGERYGHLFYEKPYSSFHLKWEYRFTDQWMEDAPHYTYRNSGVMFHSQDPATILVDQNWPISVEFQMLAEEEKGVPRPTAAICSPVLRWCITVSWMKGTV